MLAQYINQQKKQIQWSSILLRNSEFTWDPTRAFWKALSTRAELRATKLSTARNSEYNESTAFSTCMIAIKIARNRKRKKKASAIEWCFEPPVRMAAHRSGEKKLRAMALSALELWLREKPRRRRLSGKLASEKWKWWRIRA